MFIAANILNKVLFRLLFYHLMILHLYTTHRDHREVWQGGLQKLANLDLFSPNTKYKYLDKSLHNWNIPFNVQYCICNYEYQSPVGLLPWLYLWVGSSAFNV